MSKKIILTAKNYKNNQFVYDFPIEQNFGDYEVALTQFNLFNSFYNISKAIGNNIIIIGVPNASASSYTSISATIPDGFYDTASFNTYLQSMMYENNLYKLNTSGTVSYYLSLDLIATEYKNSVTFYKLSGVTLQTGVTYDSNKDIYLNVKFNSLLGELFGFNSSMTYGSTASSTLTTSTSSIIKSNLVPQINPFTSIIVTCSIVNSIGLSTVSDYLFSCSLNASYGSMIEPKKLESVYMQCTKSFVKTLTLTIYDNYFNKLNILDNNSMFVLSFKKKL